MKKILATVSCLILTFPMLSPAPVSTAVKPLPQPVKLPGQKTYQPGHLPQGGQSAWKSIKLNPTTGTGIVLPHQTSANAALTRKAIKAINNQVLLGEHAVLVNKVTNNMSALRGILAKKGVSSKEFSKISDALVAAAIQSNSWNDPEAQQQVFGVMQLLKNDGLEAHKERIDKIQKECKL